MGFWRTHYFVPKRLFQSSAQTEVFALPTKGMLSQLLVEIQAYSGTQNKSIHMADIVTKLEIIGNGSTVIKSYDGKQCQAIMCFDDLKFPPDRMYSPSGLCYGYFDIRFGRWPGDEKYALDCGRWDSLDLKITYTLAASGTLETDGFKAGTGYLTVYGLYAPLAPGFTPVGYIRSEEKRTYTTSASETFVLDLPDDYPYRRLMLFTETNDIQPMQAFGDVTIDVNNGAKRPIDNFNGDDLVQWLAIIHRWPDFSYHKRYAINKSGQNTFYTPIRYMRGGSHMDMSATGGLVWVGLDPDKWISGDLGGSGWSYTEITSRGMCPWGALCFDLERLSGRDGRDAMMAVWDCNEKDDIDLEWTAVTGSVAISILLEQYVAA